MKFLRELVNPGGPRIHAAVTVGSCAALCTAMIILALAAYMGKQVQVEFAAVVTGLSSLVGWVYNVGKKAGASASTPPGVVSGNGSTGGNP